MTTTTGRRDKRKPFASVVLDADRYRDPEFLIVDGVRLSKALAQAGFYILFADRSRLVLAPPFVHAVSEDGRFWTFQQWRPTRRPKP